MKSTILTSIFVLFGLGMMLHGQNPCGDGKIIIDGQEIDAVFIAGNNKHGFSLPMWLNANSTVAAGNRVFQISIIEFNEEPQAGGGNSLVYNQVIKVGVTPQTVPANKVWKIEAISKYADPFIAGLSASSNTPICFGDNLNLTASVAGATYAWTGPAGFTSSAQNPTINNVDFTNAGTYHLTATHNGCSYSDSVNVVINPQPASTFSNTYAIENYASTFTPTVSGQNYAWTFASGSPATSNAQNPQVTWPAAGSYQVDLTVTDGNNCSSTTQQNVTVSSCFANDPNSDFSWGAALANYATAFTPDVSGAASYNWSFDNGNPATSTQQNPNITWSSAGTYAVTLTVSTGSACYTTTQNVTVSNCQVNQPESDFSWTTPAMANTNITFTPDDMGANTYAWTFDQATPNSSANTVPNNVAWTNSGTYDVTLLTTFAGGCFTTTQQVTIFSGFHTFTNCGQTGNTGPSQGQCNTAYNSTSLNGLVAVPNNAGIQEWTVPSTGTYRIETYGARGGSVSTYTGGRGSIMAGDFSLTANDVLEIVIGQLGGNENTGNCNGAGGGGGTFVWVQSQNSPLIVSGGGGGAHAYNLQGTDAPTSNNGLSGPNTAGVSGIGGNGGQAGPCGSGWPGAGGGGWLNQGGNTCVWSNNIVQGGGDKTMNFVGGLKNPSASNGANGGFGGGGGSFHGAGGGGGYSGGGGGGSCGVNDNPAGGGGGSFITPSATNVSTSDGNYNGSPTFNGSPVGNFGSFNNSDGMVVIYY